MTKKIVAVLIFALAFSYGTPAAASVMPQDYGYLSGGVSKWESDRFSFTLEYPGKVAKLERNLALAEADLNHLEGQSDTQGTEQNEPLAGETSQEEDKTELTGKILRTRKGVLLLSGELENLTRDKEHLEKHTDLSFLPVPNHLEDRFDREAAELSAEKYIMPTTGYETSPYGWRIHPITGVRRMHNGIDLANDEGTPIQAAKSGVVKFAGYNDISGNHILLRHYDGQETSYFHMHEVIAEEGQYVLQGEVIGYMGTTGRSTGNHLHFEIRINGEWVDPDPYIYHRTRWERR